MQLILESESTIDVKTTMSLSDDSVDKSVSDILTGVQNGGISNKEVIAEKNEAAKEIEINDVEKLEVDQTKEPTPIDSNNFIEHNGENAISDVDIDASNDCNTTVIPNGKNEPNKDSIENAELLAKSHNENESNIIEENNKVCDDSSNETEPDCVNQIKNPSNIDISDSGANATEPDDIVATEITNIKASLDENTNESTDEIENIKQEITDNAESVPDDPSNTNINLSENVNIIQENDEVALTDVNSTSITEDSTIKQELEEISSEENHTELNQTSDDPNLVESNNSDIKLEINNIETREDALVAEEKETMKTDNTENMGSNESVDLICFSTSVNNDETFDEPIVHGADNDELSVINADKKEKTDEVLSIDDINIVKDEDNNSIDSVTPANKTEMTESNSQTVSSFENNVTQVDTKSSDDVLVHLDNDKKNDIEPVNVETESTLTKADNNEPALNLDDTPEVTKNEEKMPTEDQMSVDEIIDLDEPKESEDSKSNDDKSKNDKGNTSKTVGEEPKPIEPILKLSNTLDILSDDEEEQALKTSNADTTDSKCINIEDDDDIMLIDDDTSGNDDDTKGKPDLVKEQEVEKQIESKPASPTENVEVTEDSKSIDKLDDPIEKDVPVPDKEVKLSKTAPEISEKIEESKLESEMKKPLIPENFLKTCKKNLVDMTRDELEEFCILKIVESILDRSNLSEIKNKLKMLTQNLEEYKKKAMMLQKQNRDLQVVFKSVQEDVKKASDSPIVPLKITRSVGMQVLMADKPDKRRRPGMSLPNTPVNTNNNKPLRNPVAQSPRPQKPPTQSIPVPRLVPANTPTKTPPQQVNTNKVTSPLPNGVKSVSPVQKGEKRTHNRIQSVTVDLTDDEPPTKIVNRTGPMPPVRLVPSQNLLAAPRTPSVNSPRKVYIPISGPQGQNVRPGQTIMLKTVPSPGPRQRGGAPQMVRMPQSIRMTRPQGLRHPAPLPECMKQYQPPNWKALPPAPDLKLAKVENGIVISWKIEGYQEDSYEEIASYQLYAYQETTSPPNTALWKKIGDVKALPLPMACTLTQFMAGYKYYFAVRAVDIRSRLGPFSLPGSILLLNKM